MIQPQTLVKITDNSGGRIGRVFKVLGGSKKKYARIGDLVVLSIQSAEPRKQVKKKDVLHAVSAEKDVDVISHEGMVVFESGESNILPPVVGAIDEILTLNNISVAGKKVVVLGNGRLVGLPAAMWFERNNADVSVLTRESTDSLLQIKNADILVLGAGSPHFVKPDMIQKGVVILDAGTSEEAGRLAGDADPACAEKASVFTPVPGGIGPLTVAVLFRNVLRAFAEKL